MFPFPSPLLTVRATAGGGGTGVTSIGTMLNNTGASGAVPMPAYVAGDVVFVQIVHVSGAFMTTTAPAGWTLIASVLTDGNRQQCVYRRTMDGSEGSSVTFTWNGNTTSRQTMCQAITVSGVNTAGTYIEAVGTNTGLSTTISAVSMTSASVTTTGTNRLILDFCGTARGVDNTHAESVDSYTDVYLNATSTASALHVDTAASYQLAATAATYAAEVRKKNYASGGSLNWTFVAFAVIML